MTNNIDFSVLMTVYHKERPEFLEASVDSVIALQTLKPTELVLVKDGPLTKDLEDSIAALEKRYSILRVFEIEQNVGQGKASAFGLAKCSHDWVARMDSDDVSVFDRFEKQFEYISENPSTVALGGQMQEFSTNIGDSSIIRRVPTSYNEIVEFSKRRNPVNNVTTVFKKSVVEENQIESQLRFAEDYELFVRLLIAGYKIANLEDVLVYARVGDSIAKKRSGFHIADGYGKISKLMYQSSYITSFEYVRNIIGIYIFAFMPITLKNLTYRYVFRKNK